MLVKVEVVTPIRNGGAELVPTGEVIELKARDARELHAIGAVKILDPAFADQQSGAMPDFAGFLEEVETPGLIASLTDERDAARAEAVSLRDGAGELHDRIGELTLEADELRHLADGSTSEVLRLQQIIEDLKAEAPNPVLPAVSIEMERGVLRFIATNEGVPFDMNDAKAELVTKIQNDRSARAGQ